MRYSVEISKETGCWLEAWQKYQVTDTPTGLKFTEMLTESVQVCEPQLPDTIKTGHVTIDEIVEYKLSPDQTQWLLVATVKAPAPTKIIIGSDDAQIETAQFYQGFLLDRNGGD